MVDGIRHDLIVPLDGIDTTRMLEFWRWLVPETLRPLFATALGDLFLTDTAGAIWWLDVGMGELSAVAASVDEFERIVTDGEKRAFWFGEVLVDQLRAVGQLLLPMECYSYWKLPVLGGDFVPSNYTIYPVVRHFSIWGPIHEQIRHLPDGATVTFKVVE
jgi:hypothetical protein